MKHLLLLATTLILSSVPAWAQDSDAEELNLIEMELDRSAPKAKPQVAPDVQPLNTQSNTPAPSETGDSSAAVEADIKKLEVNSYEDLGRMADFQSVSVIQRRYLPKTGRFQFFLGPSLILNDPWFNVYGGTLRAGYNFSEAWGLEAGYSFMSTEKSQALKELDKLNNVVGENIVFTKNYYSIDANWTPLYGKMTWFDQQIVYYDIYFSLGYGGTEIQNGDVQSTIHLGAGQIFSLSKSMAFRWDLSWNFFEAAQIDASQGSFSNVFITAGFSFFFPEATYR